MNETSIDEDKDFKFKENYFVVAVSDVHLGFNFFEDDFPDPAKAFGEFIDVLKDPSNKNEIEHFVILGDFLDLWRRTDDELFRDHEDILNNLVDMKTKSKKIGELHYLVGNHDYNILWYKQFYVRVSPKIRGWLKEFKVKSGSSRRVKSLKLSLPKIEKTFVFRHGHQDKYHNEWLGYNLICILFGTMDNTLGRIASLLWKYKSHLPLITATGTSFVLTLLMFLSSQWLLAGIIGAITLVFLLLVLWKIKKQRSQEDSISALLKEKKYEEIKKMRKLELDSMIDGLFDKLGKPIPEDLDDVLIVGHTHDLEDNKKYNPGAWVEKKDCRILTIDYQGNVRLWKWPPYDRELQKWISSRSHGSSP